MTPFEALIVGLVLGSFFTILALGMGRKVAHRLNDRDLRRGHEKS